VRITFPHPDARLLMNDRNGSVTSLECELKSDAATGGAEELVRMLGAVRDAGVVGLRWRVVRSLERGDVQEATQLNARANALVNDALNRLRAVAAEAAVATRAVAAAAHAERVEAAKAAALEEAKRKLAQCRRVAEECLEGHRVLPIPNDEELIQLMTTSEEWPQLVWAHKLENIREEDNVITVDGMRFVVPEPEPKEKVELTMPNTSRGAHHIGPISPRRSAKEGALFEPYMHLLMLTPVRCAEELFWLLRAVRDAGVVELRERAVRLRQDGAEAEAVLLHAQADALVTDVLSRQMGAQTPASQPALAALECASEQQAHQGGAATTMNKRLLEEVTMVQCLEGRRVMAIPNNVGLAEITVAKGGVGKQLQLARAHKLMRVDEDGRSPGALLTSPRLIQRRRERCDRVNEPASWVTRQVPQGTGAWRPLLPTYTFSRVLATDGLLLQRSCSGCCAQCAMRVWWSYASVQFVCGRTGRRRRRCCYMHRPMRW
jgi:hypothetical protein